MLYMWGNKIILMFPHQFNTSFTSICHLSIYRSQSKHNRDSEIEANDDFNSSSQVFSYKLFTKRKVWAEHIN